MTLTASPTSPTEDTPTTLSCSKEKLQKKGVCHPTTECEPYLGTRKKLQEPIDIVNLAMSFGLNYRKMQGLIEKQDDMGRDCKSVSEAERNVTVLQGVRRNLSTVRTSMKSEGHRFHCVLHRLPCARLAIEEQRCNALRRAGHKLAHNCTRADGPAIYRCPVPECGGATINTSCVSRSLQTHFRVFRRDLEVTFVVRKVLRRGWGYLQIPDQGMKATGPTAEPATPQGSGAQSLPPYMGIPDRTKDNRKGEKKVHRQMDQCPVSGETKQGMKSAKGKRKGLGAPRVLEDP